MLPLRLFRNRALRGGERHRHALQLRHVRFRLLPLPVPPDGPGLLPSGCGSPHPAVDRHHHGLRTPRRDPGRALGRQAVGGDRPDPASGQPVVVGAAADPGNAVRSRWSRRSCWPESAWPSSSSRWPPWCWAPFPRLLEGVASGTNSAFREVGGVLGIAVLGAVFSSSGGYAAAQDYVNGLTPAILVGAAAVLLGTVSALLIPGLRRARSHSSRRRCRPRRSSSSAQRDRVTGTFRRAPGVIGSRDGA